MNITERQQRILKAIVSDFVDKGGPVGSSNLVKRYDLPASPATVRYEMAALAKEGLIAKPHRSAGRVPTTTGLRYFLTDLFTEKVVDYMLELEIKQRLSKAKFDRELLLRECVSILAERTGTLGFCVMPDGPRVGGISNLLKLGKKALATVFAMLEDDKALKKVLTTVDKQGVVVLLGKEIGLSHMDECAVVFKRVKLYGDSGYVGVLGQISMDYRFVIPLLNLILQTAEAEAAHWSSKRKKKKVS